MEGEGKESENMVTAHSHSCDPYRFFCLQMATYSSFYKISFFSSVVIILSANYNYNYNRYHSK